MSDFHLALLISVITIFFMVSFMYYRFGPPQYKKEAEERKRKQKQA